MRCLGNVSDGKVSLSPLGTVVTEEWLKIPSHHPRVVLDEWIVMPDHMHGILIFNGLASQDGKRDSKYLRSQSLGAVIARFKSDATKRIWWNLKRRDFAWQQRFWAIENEGRIQDDQPQGENLPSEETSRRPRGL